MVGVVPSYTVECNAACTVNEHARVVPSMVGVVPSFTVEYNAACTVYLAC